MVYDNTTKHISNREYTRFEKSKMKALSLQAKISDGIWIGDSSVVSDTTFFQTFDISAIISLDRGIKSVEDIFDYVIPGNELMDSEVPKVLTKLNDICNTIKELRENGRAVLIQCSDGKNKSALVAGYYLINRGGMDAAKVVEFLTGVYFTQAQRAEELADKVRLERLQHEEQEATGEQGRLMSKNVQHEPLSEEDMKRQEARHSLRALTNHSFRKILRTRKLRICCVQLGLM